MFQIPGRRADSLRIGRYTNFLDTTLSSCGRYYELRSASGLTLDLANASAAEGNPVCLYKPNGTRAQHWTLSSAPLSRLFSSI